MQAVWSPEHNNRCREVIFTILLPGHLIDPVQAIPYRRLTAFVKMLQQRMDNRDCLTRVRTARRRRQSRLGPLSLVMEALTELG